jgi:hypothetical protein
VFEVLRLTIPVAKCLALPAMTKLGASAGLWYLFNCRMIGGSMPAIVLAQVSAEILAQGYAVAVLGGGARLWTEILR